MREPLFAALVELDADASVKAVVVTCAGRTFVSGADISRIRIAEISAEPQFARTLREAGDAVPNRRWRHSWNGTGWRVRTGACRAIMRVADKGAKVGLPEVHLGLIPRFGRHGATAARRRRPQGAWT